MTIFESWKDSLTLCKPQAIKLLLLVTLNAMKEVLRVLCVPWFLIGVTMLVVAVYYTGSVIASAVASAFITAPLLLAARPSLRIKDWRYFSECGMRYVWFLVQLIVLVSLVFGVPLLLLYLIDPQLFNGQVLGSGWLWILYIFFIGLCVMPFWYMGLYAYASFFYLDKVGTLWQALLRAFKLIIYNLPMILLYGAIMSLISGIYWLLISVLVSIVFGVPCTLNMIFFMGSRASLGLFGIPPYLFSICLMSNIYTKRIHDQYVIINKKLIYKANYEINKYYLYHL